MQAAHDILFHGKNISRYDHLDYPGVVPRTFVGALFLDILLIPFAYIIGFLRPKLIYQLIFRMTLAYFSNTAIVDFYKAISFESKFILLKCNLMTISLFHLMFYSSRSLPNIFGLILILKAKSFLLKDRIGLFVLFSAAATLIFRSELVVYSGLLLLHAIYFGLIKITPSLINKILASGVISIILTVVIDSYFWGRWIWPEAEVFYFNTILNKSSLWGRLPFHWYFTRFLPKALMFTTPFTLIGIASLFTSKDDSRECAKIKTVLYSALSFIFLYSFLPHKEFRFIIYTIPVFIHLSIIGIDRIRESLSNSNNRTLKLFGKVFAFAFLVVVLGNVFATYQFYEASLSNYPGGFAINKLNERLSRDSRYHIYISNLAAQTGVTRYLEECDNCIYNKTENIQNPFSSEHDFTHFIVENDQIKDKSLVNFTLLLTVKSFDRIDVNFDPRKFPYLRINNLLKDAVHVYKRKFV